MTIFHSVDSVEDQPRMTHDCEQVADATDSEDIRDFLVGRQTTTSGKISKTSSTRRFSTTRYEHGTICVIHDAAGEIAHNVMTEQTPRRRRARDD